MLLKALDLVNTFKEKGVGLKSLQDPINTTRAQAGLSAATARDRTDGWLKGLSKTAQEKSLTAEWVSLR